MSVFQLQCLFVTHHSQDFISKKDFSQAYLNQMVEEVVSASEKGVEVEHLWPTIFLDMVKSQVWRLLDVNHARSMLSDLKSSR